MARIELRKKRVIECGQNNNISDNEQIDGNRRIKDMQRQIDDALVRK